MERYEDLFTFLRQSDRFSCLGKSILFYNKVGGKNPPFFQTLDLKRHKPEAGRGQTLEKKLRNSGQES